MSLKCQEYGCVHNDKEGKCFAEIIVIDGKNAKTTANTTCNSYASDEGTQSYEFANEFIEDKLASDAKNIVCAARNCMYNTDTACTAANVKINNENASCETFKQ